MVLLGSVVKAQLAEVAPDVAESGAYVELGPQSHQLVGLYHGAPSAMQLGTEAVELVDELLDPLLDPLLLPLPSPEGNGSTVAPPVTVIVVPDPNGTVQVPDTTGGMNVDDPGTTVGHPATPVHEPEVVVVVVPVTEHPERVE